MIWVALLTVKRASSVAPEPDRSRAGKIGASDGYVRPPDGGPVFGLTLVTVGTGTRRIGEPIRRTGGAGTGRGGYRYITVPIPAGAVAVIWVALLTVKEPAALLPNLTAVAPVKLVPVMVTLVPPDGGPVFGLTLVTVGTGA